MILTVEQQAEVAANRKRYDELKAAGQGQAPARCRSRPRVMARLFRQMRSFTARSFPAAGIGPRASIVEKLFGL